MHFGVFVEYLAAFSAEAGYQPRSVIGRLRFGAACDRELKDPTQPTPLLLRQLMLFFLAAIAWSVCFSPAYAQGATTPSKRAMSINDMLRFEDFGRATFVDGGNKVVFERMPPFEDGPNIAAVNVYDRSAQATLWIADLRTGDVQPLLETVPFGGYWMASVSPDGRRLLIYTLVQLTLRLGIVDLETRQLTTLPIAPNCCQFNRRREAALWISNSEVVYAAVPDDQPSGALGRGQYTALLNGLWRKAFSGREPSTTVIYSSSSGVNPMGTTDDGMLIRYDAETGHTTRLADGRFVSLQISFDRRYLSGLRQVGWTQPAPTSLPNAETQRAFDLAVVDLRSGTEKRACEDCNVLADTIAWAAAENRLTFVAHRFDQSAADRRLFEFVPSQSNSVPLDSGRFRLACTSVFAPRKSFPIRQGRTFAWGYLEPATSTRSNDCDKEARNDWFLLDGRGRAQNVTAQLADIGSTVLAADRNGVVVSAGKSLVRLAADGRTQKIAGTVPRSTADWRAVSATADGPTVALSLLVMESGEELAVGNATAGLQHRFRKPGPQAGLIALAANGRAAVLRLDSNEGTSLFLSTAEGSVTPFAHVNGFLAGIADDNERYVEYMLEGQRLSSCLLLPAGWTKERRWPMVVYVYPDAPGSCEQSPKWQFAPMSMRLLADRGYIVQFVATPSSVLRTLDGPTRGIAALVTAAVDQAVREGYADSEQLGLYGFSQGFNLALWTLTQTQRFRAAVVGNGISDFASHYGQLTLPGHLVGSTHLMSQTRYETASSNSLLRKPWEDPAKYVGNSPFFAPEAIRTPLLIFHSDFDEFPLAQSEQIFGALYRLRREAVYVTYWGEAHGNVSPANARDLLDRTADWYWTHFKRLQ